MLFLLSLVIPGTGASVGEWSIEDCSYFRQMVEERTFVGILGAGPHTDDVISMQLCDTTGLEDVYITEAMVRQRQAVGGCSEEGV